MVTYDKLITSVWGSSWGASMLLRSDELQNSENNKFFHSIVPPTNLIELICRIQLTQSRNLNHSYL